eukprot:CAMPEP_0196746090 /NCGR_PEP_ID=MMETSP1091-20130531/64424_1 /TAXON_ID=302021 /ORGANISM="Rhodomonas sp., Strain CCMP768" /LENGTH=47 /DNA_ID= /DNA_START= /DNA_END= /DNA_ORIENTATION=
MCSSTRGRGRAPRSTASCSRIITSWRVMKVFRVVALTMVLNVTSLAS